jgi:hypothetical protein
LLVTPRPTVRAARIKRGFLTFITAADPPIGQACDLRVHAHPPPILRTSGWAICTPGRLESARSAVSMSDPNTNPTVSGFPNMLLCNIFRIIARPAQSAFSEHIGQYPRAAMRPAEIYRRGAHQFDKSQVRRVFTAPHTYLLTRPQYSTYSWPYCLRINSSSCSTWRWKSKTPATRYANGIQLGNTKNWPINTSAKPT